MTPRACLVIPPLTIWQVSHTNLLIDAFPRTHCESPSCRISSNTPKTDMRKLLAMTLYSNLVYSILYLIIFAYPYSFQVVRGWKSHSYFLLDYSGLPGQVIQTSPVPPSSLWNIYRMWDLLGVFTKSNIYRGYLLNANSALAATVCARDLMAASFPLFATQMYERLGVAWATSLLAFLCIAMIPFPILFYLSGEKLRMKEKFLSLYRWRPFGPERGYVG
jgi:hypothetical protein